MVKPQERRRLVQFFIEAFGLSRRKACGLAEVSRSVVEYVSRRPDDGPLRERIHHWAREKPRYGYRRIHVLLRREGHGANRKRVYRIYREEQLSVRRKKRKRVAASSREALAIPERRNERWSMDFMADTLADGRTFRTFNVVDDCTRECVAIEVGRSIPGARVVRVLEKLRLSRGLPGVIVLDNGPEFTSRVLDPWAYERGVELHFIGSSPRERRARSAKVSGLSGWPPTFRLARSPYFFGSRRDATHFRVSTPAVRGSRTGLRTAALLTERHYAVPRPGRTAAACG